MFTWAGLSKIRFENLITFIQYTTPPNVHCLHQRLPPPVNYTIIFMSPLNYTIIFSCRHCSCTVFILFSYSLYTQVILILVLINVPYLQIVVFTLDKGLNDAKFIIPPHAIISDFLIALLTVTLFGKPWTIFKWRGWT